MPVSFPVAVVSGGIPIAEYQMPQPFTYGSDDDAVQHPATAWQFWTEVDWATMCPNWTILPLIDEPPSVPSKRAERLPMEEWTVGTDAVTVAYDLVELTPAEIEAQKLPVPPSVTNFQARAALLAAGLFDQVDTAIKAQPANSTARQAWEYANELTRNGVLVNSMAEALGLSAEQLDTLFRQAAAIEA